MNKSMFQADFETKDSYGTDRLDPEDARYFIEDLVSTMRSRSRDIRERPESDITLGEDEPSEAKQYYGDSWTLLYGISYGMNLMANEKQLEIDRSGDGIEIDHGISGDDSWQEHYDQYGYGVYGRGLEIGKRLAFYEDRDFTFSSGESLDSPSASERFTIKSYDEE